MAISKGTCINDMYNLYLKIKHTKENIGYTSMIVGML